MQTIELPALSRQVLRSFSVMTWFILTASVIFAVTGFAKAWSALAPAKILAIHDPITGVRFGYLMLAAGMLELVIAGVSLLGKSQSLSLAFIAWLATLLAVYRLGLWHIGWNRPCSCMGNLTDALHITPQAADTAMKIILVYLLIGSYASLFWLWRQKRKQSGSNTVGAAFLATDLKTK